MCRRFCAPRFALRKRRFARRRRERPRRHVWVTVGVVGVLSAWIFLLWTAAYALATILPMWAATLVVAVAMAGVGSVLIAAGLRRFKRITADAGADD